MALLLVPTYVYIHEWLSRGMRPTPRIRSEWLSVTLYSRSLSCVLLRHTIHDCTSMCFSCGYWIEVRYLVPPSSQNLGYYHSGCTAVGRIAWLFLSWRILSYLYSWKNQPVSPMQQITSTTVRPPLPNIDFQSLFGVKALRSRYNIYETIQLLYFTCHFLSIIWFRPLTGIAALHKARYFLSHILPSK